MMNDDVAEKVREAEKMAKAKEAWMREAKMKMKVWAREADVREAKVREAVMMMKAIEAKVKKGT